MRKAAALVLLAFSIGLASAESPRPIDVRHDPVHVRERHGSQVTSTNWSGYAVTDANGSVSDVKGSWTVPSVTCAAGVTAYSAFWVGIDGYASNTVEQIGTDSDCSSGTPVYYAWFEFYPHLSFTIESMAIRPNDVIAAEVSYAGGRFTVSVSNQTTGATFSTSTKMNNAKRSSAEWIIEAPSGGGVLPLADFNVVAFGANNDATIAGKTGPINSFGAAAGTNVDEISMVASDGTLLAQPSTLGGKDVSAFTDTWFNAGP